jgi:hypothetical protein
MNALALLKRQQTSCENVSIFSGYVEELWYRGCKVPASSFLGHKLTAAVMTPTVLP